MTLFHYPLRHGPFKNPAFIIKISIRLQSRNGETYAIAFAQIRNKTNIPMQFKILNCHLKKPVLAKPKNLW